MSCCINTYNVDYQGCGQFSLPGAAPTTGIYFLLATFSGTTQKFAQEFQDGSDLDFDLPVNEYNTYIFKLILPDGSTYVYTDYIGNQFDCFRLDTQPTFAFSANE